MASLDVFAGTLGKDKASHLLNRLTFGATRQEIGAFAAKSATGAVAILLTAQTAPLPPIDTKTGLAWIVPASTNSGEGELRDFFRSWLYGLMYNAGTNATEKLTFFLHTNFTAIGSVIDKSTSLYYQNQLLRKYALGNFKELALGICLDNAMLQLLDNVLNENVRPNENFAREFLELYTIGKGLENGPGNYTTYTEQDVQAAAKVLSGWKLDLTYATIDTVTGFPIGIHKGEPSLNANKHDTSTKVFSAAFQNTEIKPRAVVNKLATAVDAKDEIAQLVNMIFAQEATAKTICRKIYRFFVYYHITDEIEANIITPLAQTFIANNFELRPVFEQLFQSQHFFDADNAIVKDDKRGAIIKSPLEITIGMMRYFGITLPDYTTNTASFYKQVLPVLDAMYDQGFELYEPLDVAGYEAYFQAPTYNRNWISPNFLARRFQFAQYLLEGKSKNGDDWLLKIDSVAFVSNPSNISNPGEARVIVQELIDYLLPEAITTERFDFFLNILLDKLPAYEWTIEWNDYKTSGNDMAVRMQLDTLLNAILQSAEYQLC
jgi:uncharacterized protein (DUF1800 family)